MPQKGEPIFFKKGKQFIFKKEIAQGGCGKTFLLYDEEIDEYFVCKKFVPLKEDFRDELYRNFVQEVKILYKINHMNIVRVFNYYLYPKQRIGYIFMEQISGENIFDYLITNPTQINQIFQQTIEGFAHLEKSKILHRDIRPSNILIADDGIVKIIDFGFGKIIETESGFDTSLQLNWICENPEDISSGLYDFKTEIYFVGKLFQSIISSILDYHFQYSEILEQMCTPLRNQRIESFSVLDRKIKAGEFESLDFSNVDTMAYRNFADSLSTIIKGIEENATYIDNPCELLKELESLYPKTMLEEVIYDNSLIVRCFINGNCKQSMTYKMPVEELSDFIKLFKSCPAKKKDIVLSNLFTRLDAIRRYIFEDIDIPF